jgi:transposase-like protein
MAKARMDLSAFVGKWLEEQDGDVLREGIRVLSQALMESEVAGLIGAERHEVRPGTYCPSLLQPRRRAEHALLAVVQEAACTACRRAKSTTSSRRSASTGSPSGRCRGSVASSVP